MTLYAVAFVAVVATYASVTRPFDVVLLLAAWLLLMCAGGMFLEQTAIGRRIAEAALRWIER